MINLTCPECGKELNNEHYNKIINNLVECLKEACEMANESGPVPLKWKKAIIMATGKTFKSNKGNDTAIFLAKRYPGIYEK